MTCTCRSRSSQRATTSAARDTRWSRPRSVALRNWQTYVIVHAPFEPPADALKLADDATRAHAPYCGGRPTFTFEQIIERWLMTTALIGAAVNDSSRPEPLLGCRDARRTGSDRRVN
jgi:hypothetical protein